MRGEIGHGFREDAVIEDHRRMGAGRAGLADRIDEAQLRAAVGGQILDQQHALAFGHRALDAGIAAVAFRLFAHIGHRQGEALGDHRGKGNARGLAARDVVEGLEARVAQHGDGQKIHQGRADARIADQLAAVDIGGRGQARGEREGRLGVEMHRLDFQKHPRGQAGDFFLGGIGGGDHRGILMLFFLGANTLLFDRGARRTGGKGRI